ncbi:prolyl oligopeptidase family serine peptidase [Allokutzneria sp. NRRL B-24872]|uniref:prolyl oligopeptidase family serine peptidase n=1 Tax=Allokutzneria sp. NRRL B-24872 TaxID=1137961 RepID=UPI000A3C5585|nr:prolyl oligopeptidase family serine peptidase [Allokutzneria sp. NRRL B-24872]
MVTISPYGTWASPISAVEAAAVASGPQWVGTHPDSSGSGEHLWWAEGQPTEGGRVALFRRVPGEAPVRLLSAPWNVRNRVHEYGGRPYVVIDDSRVVFTNWDDQRVYLLVVGSEPVALTPEPQTHHGLRFGDLVAPPGGTEVWCVREEVTGPGPTDVRRSLVAIGLDGTVRELCASHRFMTAPQCSPDGAHLAWIGWNHPDMPWDATELCVAPIGPDGSVGEHRVLAGGPGEAVCQVEWADNRSVYAVTDPDGWWNLFRIDLDGTARNLAPVEDELGGPLWKLGARWFAPLGDGRHAVLRAGALAVLDENAGTVTDVVLPPLSWSSPLAASGSVVVGTASGPTSHGAVYRVDLKTGECEQVTVPPAGLDDPAWLPVPEARVFTGPDGERIPAYVYPPTNPDFAAPEGELPPYVVHVHGGPTGRVSGTLDNEFAYFTSRGIGVVAVNYGGSTGYGRAFRERLREQWGVVDVQDCAAVATALAKEGTADPDRLAIRGGSAGGWTTAASLTSVNVYRCGAAYYPILDLLGWASGETHDFESRYLDSIVGKLPETERRYLDRSPSTRVDQLAGPILMLQGLEDEICPPVQCERFASQLAGTGVEHAHLTFEGEQHGFRKAETVAVSLEAELSFYGQVLGFVPVGVPILELSR